MTAYSFRRTGCLFLIGAAACLTGLAASAAGSPSASPSALAAALASRVSTAKTAGARYNAILDVAKALHLPVFTATGKALTPGSRSLPASFNLYDFQLRVAAASFGRRSTLTVAGLSQAYTQAGGKIDGATLARQLSAGVRSAVAKSASQPSLIGLIVRDLGLHHHPAVDLGRSATPTTALDPLQALLIVADSVAHSRRAWRAPAVATSGTRSDAPCPSSTDNGAAPAPLTGSGSANGASVTKVLLRIEMTEITVVNTPLRETHYGPAGHAALAGKQLRLGVHVEIKDKIPDVIRCGLLAGASDIPLGPALHRPIFWRIGDLLKYGSIAFEPEDMTTGDTGTSTLVFTPKSEDFPGFGTEHKATGEVRATAGGPQTATAGLLTASQNWTVGFHKPRGFKFQLPAFSFLNTAGKDKLTITVTDQGRICGDDPYSKAWDVTESVSPGGGTVTYPVTLFDNQTVTSGAGSSLTHDWTLYDQPSTAISPLKVRLQITPGAPAQGTFTPPSQTQEAFVFEDKTCPDNSDGG